ncbi:response regulator [Cocleimonas sp. KMM 6892]|uniref:response regulator n=2 Tax=Cocleimonas TaxID=998014 RepID=UPI002DC20A70|nr:MULTISPECIES: response regulator [unclassified Cocleimonas]MEB8431934.1 response regulator [Cocleimonas sp. KMM 6892]MEC4714980.1 response regulator [Cocleimonas sp. KMM 6895]MEC4744206.1 response regulator [Cocleimonas sp. KMM 6896]
MTMSNDTPSPKKESANDSTKEVKNQLFIIEDDYALRDALEDYYSRVGYQVSVFDNGVSFLENYPTPFSGVIICDLRMPKMTGLEVLKSLRDNRLLPPFILMTAYGDIPSAVEAMNLGAYDFVEKPFDPKMLELKILEAFNHKKMVSETVTLDEKKRLREYVANFEKSLLIQALQESNGNIGKVCELLNVPRRTLNEKLVKYDLNRNEFIH